MEYTTPRVNPNVNCGLWLLEMRHSRFISFYKCATLVGMLIIWEAVHGGSGFMENIYQFSCSVVSDSLRPHELQDARPPCPSPPLGVHPNPRPLCWWCHPTTSSSVVPFFSCLQSFLASGSLNESTLHIRWPKYWSFSFNIWLQYLTVIISIFCLPCMSSLWNCLTLQAMQFW